MLTAEDKEKFIDLIIEFGIAKDINDYVDNIHCIDRLVVVEGMDSKTEELKRRAKSVLIEYDNILVELSAAEADLAKHSPATNATKIDLGDDVLSAARKM